MQIHLSTVGYMEMTTSNNIAIAASHGAPAPANNFVIPDSGPEEIAMLWETGLQDVREGFRDK